MNGLVQKLLTLNQLEFGNDQVVMERFDLAVLIRNKLQSVTILAQQKQAELICQCPDTLSVWGDEFKVEEVLTNYLSNALNHVSGACRITVRAEALEETVRVTVHNTGAPIPDEDLDLIWDKFYKVDKARTREYGGSGVGLSIVKAIMESFHQQYGVRNCNDGVEFWFELEKGKVTGENE
jgi:signal transduction histidine kinase